MNSAVRFAFVSNNVSLRQEWSRLLTNLNQIDLVWSGSPVQAERGLLPALRVEMVLADLESVDCLELETVKLIRRKNPRARVIGLCYDLNAVNLAEMISKGVHGFLRKSEGRNGLSQAVRSMIVTGFYISQEFAQTLAYQEVTGKFSTPVEKLADLAPRETQILELMCRDKSTQEIARMMNLSHRTVEGYKTRIRKNLGTTSLVGAAAMAVKNGWVRA